ncbi:TetR/AcrR family transcriptional regulator [Saccharopolyspora sp. CA-218241]|uniref:TetR/AcrR family transcriptional regulator n=1 Tax=Saccharopolyspora sp. CA-218241 TaxID=3240027 RepID=UPI003D9838EB
MTRARADRILDAAGELLLHHGHRKVTVEDVAERAGVGKGTVYLHWRTKRRVFEALILRSAGEVIDELVKALEQDPGEVRPHRFARRTYLAIQQRPLMRAVVLRDADLIGALKTGSMRQEQIFYGQRYFTLMRDHGLLREDFPDAEYAYGAVVGGFFTVDTLAPDPHDLDEHRKADALARTLRRALEPTTDPEPEVVRHAAAELAALYREVADLQHEWIYGTDEGDG